MYFDIRPLNKLGVPLSQRQLDAIPRLRGDIQIHLDRFTPLGRECLQAKLSLGAHLAQLPPLYDVQLTGMATLGFTLAGIEIIDGQQYPQRWHCRPLEGAFVIPWTHCPRSSLDVLL